MPARHTYDHVKDYFTSKKCRLLTAVYEGCSQILDYECQCGRQSRISFTAFKKGHRCKQCGIDKQAQSKRHPYEYVNCFFAEHRCKLLSPTYNNARELLHYICCCGRPSKIRFDEFRRGNRCRKCANEKISESNRFDYEYVKAFFTEHGCELLSQTYDNSWSLLDFRCECGRSGTIRFHDFQQGRRCGCGYKKAGRKRAHSYDHVRAVFKQKGCELLSRVYEHNHALLDYRCSCGRNSQTSFSAFKKIQGCMECAVLRRVGDKNCRWNPNRDEIKLIRSIRSRSIGMLNRQLKALGKEKTAKSAEILGYSRNQLREHLQKHPNWSKVSIGEWQIDHVFPIAAFIRFGVTDLKLINALDNLQPLSQAENRAKWDGYDEEEFVAYLAAKGIILTR